jgi:hypothetical protein
MSYKSYLPVLVSREHLDGNGKLGTTRAFAEVTWPLGFSNGPLTGTRWWLCGFELRFCVGRLAGIAFERAP